MPKERRATLATGWRPRALQTLKTSILVITAEAPRWALFSRAGGPAGSGEELERTELPRQASNLTKSQGICFRTRRTLSHPCRKQVWNGSVQSSLGLSLPGGFVSIAPQFALKTQPYDSSVKLIQGGLWLFSITARGLLSEEPSDQMHTIAVLLVVCFMLWAGYILWLILFYSLLGLLGSSEVTMQPKPQPLTHAPVYECLMDCMQKSLPTLPLRRTRLFILKCLGESCLQFP